MEKCFFPQTDTENSIILISVLKLQSRTDTLIENVILPSLAFVLNSDLMQANAFAL